MTFAPHEVKLTGGKPPTTGGHREILCRVVVPVRYVHVQEYPRVVAASRTGYDNPFSQSDEFVWRRPSGWCGREENGKSEKMNTLDDFGKT